jgi:hypothetical protein
MAAPALFKKTRVIRIPAQATVTYVDNFLKAVRDVRAYENETIVFDLSATTEVSAVFVCFICGLLDMAQERNNKVQLKMPRNKTAAKTISKVKPLFKAVGRPSSTIAERMLQLRKITSNNPQDIQDIIGVLANNVKMSGELKFNALLVMTELLTNAIDHSGDRIFYVCAGAWGRSNSLHITALDFGVGIPSKIRTRYPEFVEDKAAVRTLLTEGLTTRIDREGGRGYRIIRDVLRANGGRLHLFTGKAKAIMRFDRNEYIYRTARKEFNGTCIDLQFDLEGRGFYVAAQDEMAEVGFF